MQGLIPDLIDIGLDILMPLQFSAVGMDARGLKREYGRDLWLYGGIDVQHTLPHGMREQVRGEVRERIDVLGQGSGYILASSHGLMDEVATGNVLAMYDEARRYPLCRMPAAQGPVWAIARGGRVCPQGPVRR